MKSGKVCFMKLHFSDPFSMNSTFFSLIIPPTQERGSVAGLIKKSNTCIDVFLSTAYSQQWQITALNIHACIGCVYVIVEMYVHTYTHLYSIDTHTTYLFKRPYMYIPMHIVSVHTY